MSTSRSTSLKYFRFQVNGVVQGVNFRQWTKKVANQQNITGHIRNHEAGHVEGEALGPVQNMDNFKTLLHQGPPHAEVSSVVITDEREIASPDEISWKLTSFQLFIKRTLVSTAIPSMATGSDIPPKRREDTRQCRICLAGPEEEPDLGRLIKPCHCKGSIRYVHVKCIQEWRRTGSAVNRNSFYACGQCGFKYNLARTKILGVSTSPWVLGPTTVFLFLIIVFAASGVVSFFAPNLLDPTIPAPRSAPTLDYSGSTWWYSPFGIASEVVRETLHAFAEVSTPQEVLDAQRSEDAMYVEDTSTWFRFRAEDTSTWGRFKTKIPYYTKEKKRPRRGSHRRDPRTPLEDNQKITIWMRLTRKFMLGLSLVGILSFLNILFTIGLFGPLHLARARWVRGGRRQAGIRDAGTVIIVVFVTIGVARALYGVWKMTNRLAHWVLLRAENAILEVQDDDNDEEEEVEAKDGPRNVLTDAPRPSDTETVPQSETSTTTRPNTLRINNIRQRHSQEDDFGDELPDTPGSWREEWHA